MKHKLSHSRLSFFLFAYWHESGWKGFVGATVKIRDMAENLSAVGHSVVLFVPRCGIEIKDARFKIVEIPLINFPGLRMLSFNLFLLMRLVKGGFGGRPDVVYLRRTTTIIPLLYARLCKALFFFEVNDNPYHGECDKNRPWASRFRNVLSVKIDERNLKGAHRMFVISPEIIVRIRKKIPEIKTFRLVLMQSGANVELFFPEDPGMARRRLGLDGSCEYVCFVGSLLPHQGVGVLIGAAPLILNGHPGCRFLIIGEGPMKAPWQMVSARKGLSSSFIFTGQIPYEKVADWICAADVCVAPYLPDAGFRSPVKIFDYLACARPVVASDIPGTTGIFKDLEAVRLVDPSSYEALAQGILSLLRDPAAGRRMGTKGRDWVCEHFSRTAMAEMVSRQAGWLVSRKNKGRLA
jgi:glycosyltransferase involved in cell wall biosynthesis